jgi:hypothetical protein
MAITDRSGGVVAAGNPTMTDRRTGIIAGIACKAPCRAASTAAITLSGPRTVDGVSCVAGDRVLVKDQASTAFNGIYDVANGAWTRSTDFDSIDEIARGTMVIVASEGATNPNSLWFVTSADPTAMDTSPITFSNLLVVLSGTPTLTGLTLTSSDAGAAVGPSLDNFRDSASPAVSDFIGSFDFNGRDSVGNKQLYSRLMSQITDPISTTEDATILMQTVVAGTLTTILSLAAAGAAITGTLSATGKASFTNTTTGIALPGSTTGNRSGGPTAGDIRYNTTLNGLEYWNGTAWIVLGQAPTIQKFTSGTAQTYTAASGVVRQRVTIVGPGGGGGATITNNGANGSADTSFQVNGTGTAWTAVFGQGGAAAAGGPGGQGGTGGTDGSTGTLVDRIAGSRGSVTSHSGTSNVSGGDGGGNPRGGNGRGQKAGNGDSAQPNTGAGGGGGAATNINAGAGGGAGEYVQFLVTGLTTATYTVGAGGAGGAAGTFAGGNGAAGIILVEEFYS